MLRVETPTPGQAPALIHLYEQVYEGHYPLALGREPEEAARLLALPDTYWRVIYGAGGEVLASAVVLSSGQSGVGVLAGIAVHPEATRTGLAGMVTQAACETALNSGNYDSLYCTTRLTTPGPQRLVLRQGFRLTGVLPHAAFVEGRESLGFFVRHTARAWGRRQAPSAIAPALVPLYRAVFGRNIPPVQPAPLLPKALPRTVRWTGPGTLRTDDNAAGMEVTTDHRCGSARITRVWPQPEVLPHLIDSAMKELSECGLLYLDALLPVNDTSALHAYLHAGLRPVALYPASHACGRHLTDQVIVARSLPPAHPPRLMTAPELQPFLSPS